MIKKFKTSDLKAIGIALIVIGVIAFALTSFYSSSKSTQNIIFSDNSMIEDLWRNYKLNFIEQGSNRTLDTQKNYITTSEGESYTMLRAVLQDDRDTFNKSWTWTKNSIQHTDDHLFAWQYGERTDGTYGVLNDIGGNNSASDADSDIALALVFAYGRWKDQSYLDAAKPIIADLWAKEVVLVKSQPVLASNNLEKFDTGKDYIIVNPSYFAPYAYRIFAKIDSNDWMGLVNNSYTIIQDASELNLDKTTSAGLPPDWIKIDKNTGAINALTDASLTTNYSYDAMRLPFRLSLDWFWNKEARAKTQLTKFSFLDGEYNKDHSLATTYSHDGKTIDNNESPAIYGGDIGYFMVVNPDSATDIYKKKLESLYDSDIRKLRTTLGYYDDNWVWFGISLYNNRITNLAADININK